MRSAKNLDEFEEHWKEFLHRLERVWNKTKAHFSRSPKWHGWVSKYENTRKNDPLLSYLTNARGAEEHTVNEITGREPGGIGINSAQGNSLYIESLEQRDGAIFIKSPQQLKIEFRPARTNLLPVTNRGRTYPVPGAHLDRAINPADVPELATIALLYYRAALENAEKFFVR